MSRWIVLLAVLARFAPHAPNFSPLYGALLFAGAHLRPREAFAYPLALIAASDLLLYRWVYRMPMGWAQAWVWLGFAAILGFGRWVGRAGRGAGAPALRIASASLLAPTAFWLLSDFGVWLGWGVYPRTPEGLLACYAAALPYYRRSLVSSAVASAILFGAHEWLRRRAAGAVSEAFHD